MSVALTPNEPRMAESARIAAGASARFGRVEVADYESSGFAMAFLRFAKGFKQWLRTPCPRETRCGRSSSFIPDVKGNACG